MYLHLPERYVLKNAVKSIGKITSAHLDFSQLSSKYAAFAAGGLPNIFNPKFATGCLMDLGMYEEGMVSEQYLDRDVRTVLWRRFNRDDWAIERYGRKWSELLPDNEQITINGKRYVHWYDCLCLR